jgi:uncharacterized protein (DUF2141 family)
MKTLTKLSTTTLFGLIATTMTVSATDVTVNITNIEELKGSLYVQIFDSEKGFDKNGKPVDTSEVKVTANNHKILFKDLKAGTYAVKLFHDENENGEMDSNFIGIPKEGYGFSNNGGAFGPSSFEDAAFAVTEVKKEITIKLR